MVNMFCVGRKSCPNVYPEFDQIELPYYYKIVLSKPKFRNSWDGNDLSIYSPLTRGGGRKHQMHHGIVHIVGNPSPTSHLGNPQETEG